MSRAQETFAEVGRLVRDGRWPEATDLLRKAADETADAKIVRHLADILAARGEFEEASGIYRRLLADAPDDIGLMTNFADTLWGSGKNAEATAVLSRGAERFDAPEIALRLARILIEEGRVEEAVPYLRRVRSADGAERHAKEAWRLSIRARDAFGPEEMRRLIREVEPESCEDGETAILATVAANTVADFVQGEAWGRRAIALDPDSFRGWLALGVALRSMGRIDEAIQALHRTERLAPEDGGVRAIVDQLLIELFTMTGRYEDAKPYIAHLVDSSSATPVSLTAAGIAAWYGGARVDAIALFERAVRGSPANGWVEGSILAAIFDSGTTIEVEPIAETLAVKAQSDDGAVFRHAYWSLFLADWRDREDMRRRIADTLAWRIEQGGGMCSLIWILGAFGFGYDADLDVCKAIARSYAREVSVVPPSRPRAPRSKIRVGWLQVMTTFHSTMLATANLLSRFDRTRFELYGYGRRESGRPEDRNRTEFQRYFRGSFDVFRDLTELSDDAAADAVRADDIDVLIEMQGLNDNNSMGVMARRPARVSAVYYGFSHSTGADYVDYLFSDRVFMRPEFARLGTEKIVYLPGCHMAPTLGAFADGRLTRGDVGLPDDALVLCNFNNPWKHDPESFACWMRILRAVPDAVLWLASWNDTATKRLRAEAARAGLDPARLVFGGVQNHSAHLARLRLADLALNSFYVGGGVTSLDTLWVGVPMISTRGLAAAPSAYLGASMLAAAELDDLIFDTVEDYERTAIALCRDRPRLAGLRAKLERDRFRLPLFDLNGATRHIEAACVAMFENWASGNPPRDIDIPPMWSGARPT